MDSYGRKECVSGLQAVALARHVAWSALADSSSPRDFESLVTTDRVQRRGLGLKTVGRKNSVHVFTRKCYVGVEYIKIKTEFGTCRERSDIPTFRSYESELTYYCRVGHSSALAAILPDQPTFTS